jgi:Zn-dependent protease with chaperone function
MAAASDSKARRRLNPFAFPAETDALFSFLMVAALMIAIIQGTSLGKFFESDSKPPVKTARVSVNFQQNQSPFDENIQLAVANFRQGLDFLWLPTIFIVGVFVAAFYLYRSHPHRLNKRLKLEALTPERDVGFLREIENLSKSVGVKQTPAVLIKKGLKSQDAQAFGTRSRIFLKFDEGWRLSRKKSPNKFRAVALHELAHVVNRDVTRSYFAKSLWSAVLWLTVAPLAVTSVFFLQHSFYLRLAAPNALDFQTWLSSKLFFVGMLMLQFPATLAVFALVRARLLRVREFYADARAAAWGAFPALESILKAEAAKEKTKKAAQISALWRNHPSAAERLKVLREPHRLFQLTPELPVVCGILLSFITAGLPIVIIPFALFAGSPLIYVIARLAEIAYRQKSIVWLEIFLASVAFLNFLIYLLIAAIGFLLSYLIVRTLVLQLLRESVEKAVRWQKASIGVLRCLKIAAITGAGYEIGFFITPFALFAPQNFAAFLWILLWFPVTVGFIWLVLLYARYFGVRLFLSHRGRNAPRWKLRFLLFVVNALFCLPFFLQLVVRFAMQNENPQTAEILNQTLFFALIASLLLIALAFATSWLFATVWRAVAAASPRCFVCQTPIFGVFKIQHFCGSCGSSFAPWLFAD